MIEAAIDRSKISLINMENKLKHLEFIQTTINRMAGNLFFLRGWAITLITGLFAVSVAKETDDRYIALAFLLLLIFWILDGYFLAQERRFRDLYDDVRKVDENNIDFSMKTKKYKNTRRNTWLGAIFSVTLLWFYVPLAAAMLAVLYLINK